MGRGMGIDGGERREKNKIKYNKYNNNNNKAIYKIKKKNKN